MPKLMFDDDDETAELLNIITMLNAAMSDVRKTKTVEELQAVINNLNRVVSVIKNTIASQGKATK